MNKNISKGKIGDSEHLPNIAACHFHQVNISKFGWRSRGKRGEVNDQAIIFQNLIKRNRTFPAVPSARNEFITNFFTYLPPLFDPELNFLTAPWGIFAPYKFSKAYFGSSFNGLKKKRKRERETKEFPKVRYAGCEPCRAEKGACAVMWQISFIHSFFSLGE